MQDQSPTNLSRTELENTCGLGYVGWMTLACGGGLFLWATYCASVAWTEFSNI